MIPLEQAILQIVSSENIAEGMVTKWVLVAEVLDANTGQVALVTITDPVSPYWVHEGMVANASFNVEDEDDDD